MAIWLVKNEGPLPPDPIYADICREENGHWVFENLIDSEPMEATRIPTRGAWVNKVFEEKKPQS